MYKGKKMPHPPPVDEFFSPLPPKNILISAL